MGHTGGAQENNFPLQNVDSKIDSSGVIPAFVSPDLIRMLASRTTANNKTITIEKISGLHGMDIAN
jgi:hypothetical protein